MVTSYRTGRTSRTNREAPEGCSLHRLGIGHLLSGDRCTQTRPTPSTHCGSPSWALPQACQGVARNGEIPEGPIPYRGRIYKAYRK